MNLADLPIPSTITEKYILGSAAPFIATALSFLPELEAWFRILALLTGIIISILSFLSAESEKKRRRNKEKESNK